MEGLFEHKTVLLVTQNITFKLILKKQTTSINVSSKAQVDTFLLSIYSKDVVYNKMFKI